MAPPDIADKMLSETFGKLDRIAFGAASGLCLGLGLFAATIGLVLKGGETVGPHLALLGQFFPGYEVTAAGSLIGLLYGFMTGYVLGWGLAFVHFVVAATYVFLIRFWVDFSRATDFIDPDHSGR